MNLLSQPIIKLNKGYLILKTRFEHVLYEHNQYLFKYYCMFN